MAQSNDNDDIKWLYSKLKAKGYNIGSEADFKSSLANSEDRKWYYEKAKGMGLNMGSMADFDGMYAPKAAPKPHAQPQPQAKPQPTTTAAPTQQKPAAAPAPSRPAPQPKPSGNQPLTLAQRQTMINQVGQMMQQTQAMTADFNDRMKNMQQYGLGLNHGQTKIGGLKYNPRTGKLEQTYLTPDGKRYTSKALADAESYRYRKAQSEPLPIQMNDAQIAAAQKPADSAVAALWKEAEAKLKADRNKNAEEVYGGNPWLHGGREMHIVDAATNAHKNEVSRLTRFDLQKMMDNAWGRVGNQMTRSCYEQLRKQYPNASEQQLQNTAKSVARQLSDNSVYKYAVAKNTPKSTLEFFAKTAADMNLLNTLTKGLARSEAGTAGDLAAYEQAMGEYGKHHRVAQIGGTILGMGLDPTTVLSMGSGSVASRAALNVGGRLMAKKAATNVGARLFGSTLKGRVVAGAAGGAANFGTYEGIKEAESQYLHGGHINAETGENEGYSAGEILKSTGRGTVLGSVTGTFSPLIGNVSDKLVKATSSTAGKAGVRLGELATSTVAEGTVFSVPEWINGNSDAMDVWTDNMAMMLGFKAQHMVKSAPRVIAGLRPVENPQTMQERNHNRMNFMERLRKQMDASPRDMAFTDMEREELRKQGYGELADLFKHTPKQKQTKPQQKPTTTDGKTMTFDIPEADVEDLGKQWLKNHPEFDGYEAMERLVQDPTVSQSARAKAYYILTGRQLPMGTVTGYSTETDEHGNIFVKAMTANGEVVTNKRFADEASAKREQDNILRQAELNSVDVGERYRETAANIKVVQAAVEQVAPGADFETVMRNYKAVKSGDADAVRNYGEMVREIDKAIEANKGMADAERPEAIRAAIKEETGVDVDEAIKKGPGKRTEQEQAAVEDYMKRLFPEEKGAETGGEQPMSEDEAEAADIYDRARLTWEGIENGDPEAKADVDDIVIRMQEAYQLCEDAFGADAEWRMAEMQEDPWAMVNNPELTEDQQDAVLYYIKAKAAMDGVQDASNDAMDTKRKEVYNTIVRHTHKDNGTIQPATMKVDDKQVYIVKGNVVAFPDGSGIDTANSDQSIVICDAETGEYKFTSPDQIFSLGEPLDAYAELQEAYANIQAEHEAVFGGTGNGEEQGGEAPAAVAGEEAPQTEAEAQQPQMTEEQMQQYAQGVFDEATQGNGGITLPEEQVQGMQQYNQQMLEAEQQRKAEEANRKPTALSRIPVDEQTGEPMFERADRETALDALNEVTGGNAENTRAIVNAQLEQATKAVEALKKKAPTKKPTTLKGSPMQMVKAQQEADAAYNAAMEQYNAQVGAAEESQKAWTRIYTLMNDRSRAIREQQEAEWRTKEAKLHDEAVAQVEEQKRIAAEKAAEQAAVGTHAVNPKLKAKWDAATKVEGNPNAITLEDGSTLRGHYVLTEAGAATASHDVDNGYEPTEGFPIDENGESVNDRDYKRDKDAQRIVQDIANNYDSRALQSPVIVSKDGIVLSGNNRTMSGEIAARQNTDKAYTDHLKEFGQMYGFTPEQVESMKHPRVVFVPDEELPYDASTFARFNAESQKKQSKPEHAVKLGKVVPDNVFNIITGDISRYDRLSDYYADDKAVSNAISQLLGAGVINEMQLPELRTGNSLSAAGRELIENTLIGKVFQTSPDAVRQIIAQPTLRQSVVMGLNEIAHNRTLAKSGYDLSGELAAAVDLVSRAKSQSSDIYKDGMPVSPFGRQAGLFDDEYGDSRVTDGVTLLLADLLNSGKPSDLRKVLSAYNQMATSPASGQLDMFSGEVTPKEQILQDTLDHFRNATPKEQQALVDAAIAERKRRAEAAAAEPSGRGEASEQTENAVGSSEEPQQPAVAETAPAKQEEPKEEQPLSAQIKNASADVNTEPTEAQKEAGNYKKGHVQVGTFDITIEQPEGSVRRGTDANGKQWESKMHNTYGYFRGTEGVDGDHIDVFLSNDIDGWNGRKVYVVDQYNPDGTFDEHKVMLGFNDMDEAKSDYLANYEKGWEDGRRITVSATNLEDFEKWIGSSHRKTKPFSEYSSVNKDTVANSPAAPAKTEATTTPAKEAEATNEENSASAAYTIEPSTYTNKKGKTSNVSLLKFNGALTAEQERAVKEFAKERIGEGRFSPARGWKDRESGGWMFRNEEDARKAAEMVGSEEAVADAQPMTAQELRQAVEPKTEGKRTSKQPKPANKVEAPAAAEPIKEEKPKYEVSDEEMSGLMNDIRDILGIGDDEGDAGFHFRDPDELTAEQRQKLMSVGQRLAMAMVERGNESFADYASMMVKALGDKVRPWLKAFYGGLEYVPGYDKYALTPYEEVKAFDAENFDKPQIDALAQADMIVEEGKVQVAADKANNELKAKRNEQRKADDEQRAADTATVAEKAETVASEAETLAETSSDEQALNGATEQVDDALGDVNDQLALLGYYGADRVEKDYNEAYGYMRNAEKKAVKDAAGLAEYLIDDLGLDYYAATHAPSLRGGTMKKKPLAVANIAPAGGDITIHLPLNEGHELYISIGLHPTSGKGKDTTGDDLEVDGIMYRVERDKYSDNHWAGADVTYADLLKGIERIAYKYLPGKAEAKDGEYHAGDKVQYSPDGGRTWHDAIVVQPNDEGGVRIDTGQAPVMYVNAHLDQLRHKEKSLNVGEAVSEALEHLYNDNAALSAARDYNNPELERLCADELRNVIGDDNKELLNTFFEDNGGKLFKDNIVDAVRKRAFEDFYTKAERIAKAKREKARTEADIDATDLPKSAKDKAKRALHGSDSMTDNAALAEAERRIEKKKKSAKEVKPEQPIGDLFAGLMDEEPETKVEAEVDGNTDIHRTFANTVKNDMLASLDNGTKPYRGILDLRKRAKELGMDVDNEGRTDILLQELVEDGLVRAAREVTERMGSGNKEAYDLICKLYDMQPTISARSSNRIKMQQYSTPLPMAWNADHFAMHGKDGGKVLEPTAGNGMLVFGVPAKQVHANELDETRLANLREQGFAQVTQQDATEPFEGGKQYDAIISNPPFGKREAAEYDGKMIGGLDPQITLNALASMKDDGRAAIIIGGNMEYAANGSIKNMKPFFTYLYDHYNVKGVVDMDGKLYAKQGTTFPTRMILIDGRRSEEERAQSAVYPPVKSKAVRKAESFEDLYNIIDEITNSSEKTNGTEILRSQQGQLAPVSDTPSRRTDREGHRDQHHQNDEAGRREPRTGTKPASTTSGSQPVLPRERGANTGNGEARREPAGDGAGRIGGNTEPAVQRVGGDRVSTDGVGLAPTVHAEPKKRELTDEKSAYRPHNTAYSLKSVAPAAMVEAMDNVLTQIEKEHGSIDNFVTTELGYDSVEDAHHALAAEQMDSVAMAVYQMKHGQALIIGDQTGVGKGRQMAALIRWAVKRGEKPVFITQKADLFSDIYRDLVDVGSGDLVPFIFNSDGAMVDSNGKTVHKPLSQKEQAKVFASGKLPDEYDFAVLTYSQVNTGDEISQKEFKEAARQSGARVKKSKSADKPTPKATFLRAIAKDNYLFLDESHTAAGTSNTGAYLQSILRSARAATFASATFAKRPDTMPLYAIRTAMSQANVEPNKMISIIEKGGVTLQEIMSRELTNAGQMVRRERDMSDVRTDWKTIDDAATVKRARENYDKTIAAFNAIIKFQEDYVKPLIDILNGDIAVMAGSADVKRGTDKMGVDNVPFASKTYNYTKQLMLALKVDAIPDEVEKEINAGRHPVIALESTMESSIKDYAAGETIDEPTFSASLLRGLDSVMQYTIKDENGKEQHLQYRPSDLGEAGEKAYYELQNLIRESTSDIFISPLDAIIDRLHEKGYKVGELTGRNMYVERGDNGKVVVKRRTDKDKKRMQREFNNGELDVLILNKSASTGISLHASEKFSDQRQRSMIIAQPLSDINDYMQMIGRIDRTGQVHRGYYINLGLPVPAENRFLMMLSTKLKSLNANTTTSQDSESNEVDAPDLLNKYGSQVVVEYLRDNPDVYEKMGAPLKKGGMSGGKVTAKELDDYKAQEDDARKITGYVALLSTKEQEDFYDDVVRRYNELIKYLNDTGNNDLKITVMPLRAKTLEKRVSSAGIDPNGSNPFAQNSYVEKVEMDVLRKPMKAEEVRKTIEQVNKGKSPEDYMRQVVATINAEDNARLAAEDARYEKDKQRAEESIAKQAEKINAQKKRTAEEKAKAIADYTAETHDATETKHKQYVERIKANSRMLKHSLNQFEVGKSYLVPDNLETQMFDFAAPAIFCGYKTKDSKITASTTLAVFATLDGRRRVEVKLSQTEALRSIDKMTNDNWDSARSTTLDNWDSQIPTETRKEGYIMTGNILQAIADTQDERGGYPGQLISYTDMDGNVHDGILMPDKWNSTMLKGSGAPIISRMQQIKNYELVKSSDGNVEITGSAWAHTYYLTVPKTKKDGAKFFENPTLLRAAGGNFYPNHGKLRADIAEKDIETVVKELSRLGVKVQDDNPATDDGQKFRLLEDDDPKVKELEALPEGELVPVYRNVQAFGDDALGSPMAFFDAETGERRTLQGRRWNYSEAPKVELTEEQQRKLDELNKNGYLMVNGKQTTELPISDGLKFVKPKTKEAQLQYLLKKNPEDSGTWAAYDPYDHAIETPLNTQFAEAYKRPNLVVVRSLIPKSEITEPFHADYALLPTGAHQWNNGRTLYLSRWSKIDKVLSREEEAKLIDEYWKKPPGKREALKTHRDYNRFVPEVRKELEKMGYRFEHDGKELTPEESLTLDQQREADIIPGMEGHLPYITGEDIERINAKMSGKWVGEPKDAMESEMAARVEDLSKKLGTPVRIIRTDEEVAALPTPRQRKQKGSFNTMTGEVTIVVPNNANLADVENTFMHEVVGHDGLRVLFPTEEKLNNALDELYRMSNDSIKHTIERMAQKMYDAEVDRLREQKRKAHEANGEDANAAYYADMAEAHAEASKKRDQFKRDATEEYGADLAGRIGESGFEKMSADELSFWGRLKAMLQKALEKLLNGLHIPGKRKWGDKEWSFVLHEAYKRKKNGGNPTVFDAADTEVMKRKTGFDEAISNDGKSKSNGVTISDMKQKVADLFEKAHTGEFTGRPQSIGRLSKGGKAFLEKMSGLQFKEYVDFVLNPSDLNHIRGDHYGQNEKDKGNNIPLTDEDIRNMVEVLNQPDGILYGIDKNDGRKMFFFLKDAGNGLYNLTEVCSTKKGNLTAKSFFKSKKKGIDQRVMEIRQSLLPTSVTYSGEFLSSGAKIPTLFENNEVSDKNVAGDEELMFRDGNNVDYEKAQARNLYEERVSRGLYQMQEALQDSMLGLKEAMTAVLKAEGKDVAIEDVDGYENAYLGENRLSSVNQAECDEFARSFFKPMLKEVAKLAKTADERAALTDYMMAKHGLERNDVMARRAAAKVAKEEFYSELRDAERAAAKDPLDQDAQDALDDVKQRMHDREEELYFENRERDYSGLTALTSKDNVVDAEAEAERMVRDYESSHDTAELWGKVFDVTQSTLHKAYASGMIDRNTYNDIRTMYKNYIPLRGFDEKTSEEAYSYLRSRQSMFNAPIKTAKGRKSKADDPFANMEAMAESAIMQGNRNVLVKQKFLNFALKHPSDLVSVSNLWLRYDDAADEWRTINTGDVAGTEALEADDSPADVERKMADFEEAMKQLQKKEPKKYRRQKEDPTIPYRVVDNSDLWEHQVLVKRNGRDYVLTVNGNPRAAQALNGETNPDNDMSGAIGAILHWGEAVNRQLSAFYTTRNPDFVVSNFVRDMIYANTMVWVKESGNYAWRFHLNFAKVNPVVMKHLFAKLRNGKLDRSNPLEKQFREFMLNGGETGYSSIKDIERRKNDIKRELKMYNGKLPLRKAWMWLGERLDEYNRAVENCARFAAYLTSRQMKRSIERSVYDAKEISVNFNKKGSGAKFMGDVGQTKFGNAGAFVSGFGRSGYVFWNAAVQGTTNFGKQAVRHPKKAFAGMAAMYLLGVLMAALGHDDDENEDNKNSYYNLPEYVRRNNIVFRVPGMDESWVSIPLPVEYRSMYGMGELTTSVLSGKEHYTGGEIASQMAGQMSQLLPIDIMEGSGGWKPFVPSAIKPFAEIWTNEGWTGMPIYKDTPWNKDDPEWTKAYKSANGTLVGMAKSLNELTGGDPYTKGWIDINPAKVEYLLNGYFGGVSNTVDKLLKMGETAVGKRDYDPRSFLVVNRLLKSGDERTEQRAVNNEYFRLKEEHDKLKARLKHYEDDTANGVFDYAEKISWLNNSPEYRRMVIFEEYNSDIEAIKRELKEPMSDDERKSLEEVLNALKKELVDAANKEREQQ